MEKKDRLLSLIDHYSGGNKSEFARMIGVSPQAVSTWITRNTFDIDIIYAKCLNISPDWLLTGKGNMLKGEETEDVSAPVVSYDPKVGQPFYNVDFLGGFSEVYNSQVSVPDRNIIVPGFDRAKLWCNVTGHSMEPKINHGDIIALRPCTLDDIQYGEIYAVVLDTIRTIKILRKGSSKNSLRYVPINPNFDEQEFAIKRIINIFEVIGSISKFF
jgi:bacteriophage CI repressor helix-turn-helix domain